MIAGCGTLLPTRSIHPRKPLDALRRSRRARRCSSRLSLRRLPRRRAARTPLASSRSSFAPKPLAPLLRQVRTAGCCAVPAMSTCAHGMPSTNSSRKSAAVIEPALTPPMLVRSAIEESSWRRYGRCSGSSQTGSSATSPARLELLDQVAVVAHHPGDVDAEGAQAGAGEGGDVDDGVHAVLDRQAQPVGHHEASLGVGVEHLDRGAVAHPQHVAELHRRAGGHVVGAAEVRRDGTPDTRGPAGRSSPRGWQRRRSCRSSSGHATRRSA